ncbi:MAG TPA: carboxypeptidase-like regulatory domain-containing protein [Gemmatimonadaceae bacterium]
MAIARFGWILLAIVSGSVEAQEIRGVVRDAATGTPIPGVVVLALDSTSTMRSRVVANARGEYRVASASLVRTLRFVRIGFAPEERVAPPTDTGSARLVVTMRAVSQLLAALHVRANASCPKRADSDLAFSLWDQASAALLAAVVARETNPPQTVRVAYKRVLSRADRIEQQLVQIDSTAVTARSFVAVLSSEDFARGGFSRDTSGMRHYLVPYADALLEDEFLSRHCFRVVDGGATRRNQVGVAFETARRERRRVDVDGIVWVDTAARTLQRVEFHYVGVSIASEQARAGGEIWFRQMANGLLVIDRWHIRGAGARERAVRDEFGELPLAEVPIVATQFGGEVVQATWPDGSNWHASLSRLTVRGVDASGNPVSGFEVRLRGTNYGARANEQGVAELGDLLPGPYRAVVTVPSGGPLLHFEFTAQRDAVVDKRIRIAPP